MVCVESHNEDLKDSWRKALYSGWIASGQTVNLAKIMQQLGLMKATRTMTAAETIERARLIREADRGTIQGIRKDRARRAG